MVARKFNETASLENLHKNELCTLSFTFLLQATSVSTIKIFDSSKNTHVSLNTSSYIIWNWHNLKILFLFFSFFFMMSLHKSASLLCTYSFIIIIQESALHSKYDTSYLALIIKKILIPGILKTTLLHLYFIPTVCVLLLFELRPWLEGSTDNRQESPTKQQAACSPLHYLKQV